MAGPQDTFINSILQSHSPEMQWPSLELPGFPSFLAATFSSWMAGINYVLQYVPPTPNHLPSLPSIDIFVQPFLALLNIPTTRPEFSFGLITIPGVSVPGVPAPLYPVVASLKLAYCFIMSAYETIKSIITDIIAHLQVKIPTAADIQAKLFELLQSVALVPPDMPAPPPIPPIPPIPPVPEVPPMPAIPTISPPAELARLCGCVGQAACSMLTSLLPA